MISKFAVFLIIVVSQASFISCDDKKNPLDKTVKQLAEDVAAKVLSGMVYLQTNVLSTNTDAIAEFIKNLLLVSKLHKADKIIEELKVSYEKVSTEHNSVLPEIIKKIKSDTAATGGAENPFVKELISMVTALQDHLLKLVFIVRDNQLDQINLVAEDLKKHVSGKEIAEKLQNGIKVHHDVMLKGVIAMNLDLHNQYKLVRHALENVAVSAHTLGYMDENVKAMVFSSFDKYIKARGQATSDVDRLATIVSHAYGHHKN